ncbi:MAG: phosphoribosylformylglycinamidine synthase [Planctomycetes bacterium]|nr:phosphoribosylformylglycinamidine synthase [Planctomycetota bacterium]
MRGDAPTAMPVFRIEIVERPAGGRSPCPDGIAGQLRDAGLEGVERVVATRLFFLEGDITRAQTERIAAELLADPVTETSLVCAQGEDTHADEAGVSFEIHPRPGVMDPVALSTLAELRAEGYAIEMVRTARRYCATGSIEREALLAAVPRVLANDCIEQVVAGTAGIAPGLRPPVFDFDLRTVEFRSLDDDALETLSRDGHLFLSLQEMRAIRAHFQALDRDPTDLEIETIAQTWSEHCVHKTFKSEIEYHGAPMPAASAAKGEPQPDGSVRIHYANLLRDTIVRATDELIAAQRGPNCLSVFVDNAGVIAFDDQYGIAFKAETHNHPSAIEPYGGAATGIGGCIRDVIGCGLGARPIASTDVFCVAPPDWPLDELPAGVLHPQRVLRGVVKGVADYGNRIGIPTVNGAVCFDPRYLGNPLVYVGCVGLIPRDKIDKAARPGDLIVLVGGRTGRDGIHGATFSSAELTDSHADEFSHAVQIGNAITEKRFLDAIMQARDAKPGCLYSAITDCGAGGLSSAVGEMGELVGAQVDLEKVPLKYAGLRYDEIWISEAQERMILSVPPENIDALSAIMRAEDVETTVIGVFGAGDSPRLVTRFQGTVVGDLPMPFLHDGLPKQRRTAEWQPASNSPPVRESRDCDIISQLKKQLSRPTVASKEWIIRQYDHEVQGASVVKPLCGPGFGPSDAAVLRPRLDSQRGIAIACGIAPHLSDIDPYWMAMASIDEALRNIVCVGGDPAQTALLDNFCWGRTDDPWQLGGLVRAAQACYDGAIAYGVPFVSGKDSLNNEFALDAADVDKLVATLRDYAERDDPDAARFGQAFDQFEQRLRRTGRLSIPGTLLISAVSIVLDVNRCITADLKQAGNRLLLLGGLPVTGFSPSEASGIHQAVAGAIQDGMICTCHDSSDGGWATAVAEMAIAGNRGAELETATGELPPPLEEQCDAYVVETADADRLRNRLNEQGVRSLAIGQVRDDLTLSAADGRIAVDELRALWTS